ncbi:hypothetical protein U1Q18_002073 [Sarracenia purpurea var. burkii]
MAEPTQRSIDSDLVECLALWKAVTFTRDLGIQNIHIEGDSLTVIKEINSTGEDRSYLGGIMEAIKAELALFSSSKSSHIHRNGNSVAHELVRLATYIGGRRVMILYPYLGLVGFGQPSSGLSFAPVISELFPAHPMVLFLEARRSIHEDRNWFFLRLVVASNFLGSHTDDWGTPCRDREHTGEGAELLLWVPAMGDLELLIRSYYTAVGVIAFIQVF